MSKISRELEMVALKNNASDPNVWDVKYAIDKLSKFNDQLNRMETGRNKSEFSLYIAFRRLLSKFNKKFKLSNNVYGDLVSEQLKNIDEIEKYTHEMLDVSIRDFNT